MSSGSASRPRPLLSRTTYTYSSSRHRPSARPERWFRYRYSGAPVTSPEAPEGELPQFAGLVLDAQHRLGVAAQGVEILPVVEQIGEVGPQRFRQFQEGLVEGVGGDRRLAGAAPSGIDDDLHQPPGGALGGQQEAAPAEQGEALETGLLLAEEAGLEARLLDAGDDPGQVGAGLVDAQHPEDGFAHQEEEAVLVRQTLEVEREDPGAGPGGVEGDVGLEDGAVRAQPDPADGVVVLVGDGVELPVDDRQARGMGVVQALHRKGSYQLQGDGLGGPGGRGRQGRGADQGEQSAAGRRRLGSGEFHRPFPSRRGCGQGR